MLKVYQNNKSWKLFQLLNKTDNIIRLPEASSKEIFLRQCQLRSDFSTSAKQNSSNQSSNPIPPSSSSNQTLWIGVAAAVLLGGGSFIVYSMKGNKDESKVHKGNDTPVVSKKRNTYLLRQCQSHN